VTSSAPCMGLPLRDLSASISVRNGEHRGMKNLSVILCIVVDSGPLISTVGKGMEPKSWS
jgi:hypothetical protein